MSKTKRRVIGAFVLAFVFMMLNIFVVNANAKELTQQEIDDNTALDICVAAVAFEYPQANGPSTVAFVRKECKLNLDRVIRNAGIKPDPMSRAAVAGMATTTFYKNLAHTALEELKAKENAKSKGLSI